MDSNLDEFDEQDTGRNPLRDRMKQLESENAELKARLERLERLLDSNLNGGAK